MKLPDKFKLQMEELLGNEYSDFDAAINEPLLTSVRLNPFKPEHSLELGRQVPWCPAAFYLPVRPSFTNDPYFHAGHYYVQEASSMILDDVVRQLSIPKNGKVLDLCSAPGGKASLMASYLSENGFLHCHEHDPYRANILRQNIHRWGTSNTLVSVGPVNALSKLKIQYDLVVVDAPCSGEGMFRKERRAIEQWNQNKVNNCCYLQKQILEIADALCQPGGYIFYSTCTYNEYENEHQLKFLLDKGQYKSISFNFPYNIKPSNTQINTYRCYPHLVEGEGFTFSVLQKEGMANAVTEKNEFKNKTKLPNGQTKPWLKNPENFSLLNHSQKNFAVPNILESVVFAINSKVKVLSFGTPFGVWKKIDFYPEHELSQSIHLSDDLNSIHLSGDEARTYLKCLSINKIISTQCTWLTAKYNQAILGWFKNASGVPKNYYPKYLRILSN